MKTFMDNDFMLKNEAGKRLYSAVKDLPIIDYHCHISPAEIAENKVFDNVFQVFLGGDHYKWRQMRSNGIEEKYITGDAPDFEKFKAFAKTMPKLIGNPIYHWTHMELRKYFGVTETLCGETCGEIWNKCNEKLKELPVRKIIEMSNVEVICTTDDPCDDLKYHEQLAADKSFKTKVYPAFRPDKAINIDKDGWADYIAKLSAAAEIEITDIASLKQALSKRVSYFAEHGCFAADHGLDYMPYETMSERDIDEAFKAALCSKPISQAEADAFKLSVLKHLAAEYTKLGWTMELHYSCIRNNNKKMFRLLGADTGFDAISSYSSNNNLAMFLNELEENNSLPKTIIFSLNPIDNAAIGSIIGCFQGTEAANKIQQGPAWWFNDAKKGIEDQLVSYASLSTLGNFVGMLTDSRSFLSYTRHDYFRRILCNMIGTWVEDGELPADFAMLEKTAADISYFNAKRYFGL